MSRLVTPERVAEILAAVRLERAREARDAQVARVSRPDLCTPVPPWPGIAASDEAVE